MGNTASSSSKILAGSVWAEPTLQLLLVILPLAMPLPLTIINLHTSRCYSTREEITGLGSTSGITGLVDVLVAKYF